MPSLLDGRIDHYKNQYEKIASSRDSSQNGNLILDTTNDGNTSPAVGDFDYSQPVHEDEISLFDNIEASMEEEDDKAEVNVTDCGKCDFLKEENRYAQTYFEKEYGELHCCNNECKNPDKKMREFIDTKSDKCFWVCSNCKRNENGTHGCSKMFCNTCYFLNAESNNSGRNSRGRRSRST